MIDAEFVAMTCRPGSSQCCRYLARSPAVGWVCVKWTQYREILDKRVVEGTINATGDNCEGQLP